MTLESLDVVFYTSLFLVPGYVVAEIRGAFCTTQKDETDITLLQYLLFSILNCALWSWLYNMVFQSFAENKTSVYWLLLLAISLVGACITGLFLGLCAHYKIARKLFGKMNVSIHLPEASAWDYKFENLHEGRWVIVTLKSKQQIYGVYGETSFSSSSEGGRDLYLEKTYQFDEGTGWKEMDRTDGVLINKDEISFVEFIN